MAAVPLQRVTYVTEVRYQEVGTSTIAKQFGEGAFETELCALVIETRR